MSLLAPPAPVPLRHEHHVLKTAAAPGWISVHRNLLMLLAIVTGAACLRFHLLAYKSFWFDEGFSVGVARLDWPNFLHLLWVREANMALYYVLLKLWLTLGMNEFYVRALSVVFGLATIRVVYALGKRLFGARAGLSAALLLSINAFHVRYSQEARGYGLLVFLSALGSLLFVRCIENPTARNWWLYTLGSVLIVYSHFYGVLAVAAHWLSLILLPREYRPSPPPLRWLRFFAYGTAPIAIFLCRAGTQPMNWLPRPNAASIRYFFECLVGNGGYLLLGTYVLAWAAAAYARVRSDKQQCWHYDLMFLWVVFPIAVVLGISQFKSIFLARYLIVCLPASVLLAAAGISRLRLRFRVGVLLLVTVLSVGRVFAYYQHDFDVYRDNWRAATHYVLANTEPGDGIFFYAGPGRMTFDYYRSLAGKPTTEPEVIYPSSGNRITYRDFLVSPLAEVLQDSLPQPRRVWLFLNQHRPGGRMDMGSEFVCAWYGTHYTLTKEQSIDGIDILLYDHQH